MPDPSGRLDILLTRICDRMVEQQNNPVVTALYETFKPVLHEEIERACRKNEFSRLARQLFGRRTEEPEGTGKKAAGSGKKKRARVPAADAWNSGAGRRNSTAGKRGSTAGKRGSNSGSRKDETIIDAEFEMIP